VAILRNHCCRWKAKLLVVYCGAAYVSCQQFNKYWTPSYRNTAVLSLCFCTTYRSFATRVSQLKIWHFLVIGIERNVRRCTFNRFSVIMQFVKLAAGEQLCRRCTHTNVQHFKSFKPFSWKIPNFDLQHCCLLSQMSDTSLEKCQKHLGLHVPYISARF
jgi:hypothetical protein